MFFCYLRLLFRNLGYLLVISLISLQVYPSNAQEGRQAGDPIVIEIVQLDHADADQLASALAPLFPNEVQLIPYSRTNTLIIKGRISLVKKLVRIIKGSSYPNQ